jgi:replicative DNA helicase
MSTTWHYEAEQGVLGSMMLDQDAAYAVSEILKPDDFYRNAHRILYRIFAELVKRGKPIDILLVEEALTKSGQMSEIGNPDYLLEIAEFVPSPANAMYYAGLVQEYAVRRRMQQAANRIFKMVEDGATPDEFTDYIAAVLGKVTVTGEFPAIPVGDIVLDDDYVEGVPTGWKSLDDATGTNGLAYRQVTMVSADTGRGKSTLMHSMALDMAKADKKVLYAVWADLDEKNFKKRTVKMLTGNWVRPYTLDKAKDFEEVMKDLSMGVYAVDFIDVVEERLTELEVFFAHLARVQKTRNYDAVFLDYAQSFELQRKCQNDTDKQVQCARLCALKAKQIGVPLVVGSQIGEDGKTAYSREWERVCAMNLLITDEGLLVKKSRHFGQAKGRVLPIQFNQEFARYEDRTR